MGEGGGRREIVLSGRRGSPGSKSCHRASARRLLCVGGGEEGRRQGIALSGRRGSAGSKSCRRASAGRLLCRGGGRGRGGGGGRSRRRRRKGSRGRNRSRWQGHRSRTRSKSNSSSSCRAPAAAPPAPWVGGAQGASRSARLARHLVLRDVRRARHPRAVRLARARVRQLQAVRRPSCPSGFRRPVGRSVSVGRLGARLVQQSASEDRGNQ